MYSLFLISQYCRRCRKIVSPIFVILINFFKWHISKAIASPAPFQVFIMEIRYMLYLTFTATIITIKVIIAIYLSDKNLENF